MVRDRKLFFTIPLIRSFLNSELSLEGTIKNGNLSELSSFVCGEKFYMNPKYV